MNFIAKPVLGIKKFEPQRLSRPTLARQRQRYNGLLITGCRAARAITRYSNQRQGAGKPHRKAAEGHVHAEYTWDSLKWKERQFFCSK